MANKEILEWNYKFPLDYWWRSKHKVPLFSSEHLSANQMYITMEYLEDNLILDSIKKPEESENVVTDSMFKDSVITSNDNELFDNLEF